MASSSTSGGLILLLFLSLIVVGTAARPCKTLFIAYTFSSDSSVGEYTGASIEVSQISDAGDQSPTRFLSVYRLIPLRYYLRYPSIERPVLPRHVLESEPSIGMSSLRERARDILAVVAGLLFGVGCAALTSASVYLAWYLINTRHESRCTSAYDFLEDDDESVDGMESPKKMGYVGIPASPATPVAPLKEVSEGN